MSALTGFRILLPPGWSQYRVDPEGRTRFIAKLAARMKQFADPELDIRLRMLANAQWRQLEQTRTHSVYLADRDVDGLAQLPLSIAVRQHVAPPGTNFGRSLVPLAHAPVETIDTAIGPVRRWQRIRVGDEETPGIVTRSHGYGFVLPDSDDRRGLVFVASIPHPADADPQLVDGAGELVDTIMETFRWR